MSQDVCYYAYIIFLVKILLYPRNEKAFYGLLLICWGEQVLLGYSAVCTSVGKWFTSNILALCYCRGTLAWTLIAWRCSLVFSSVVKIFSVLIYLLPGELDLLCLGGLLYKVPLNNGLMLSWGRKKKYGLKANN